jgi:hypothetical protein
MQDLLLQNSGRFRIVRAATTAIALLVGLAMATDDEPSKSTDLFRQTAMAEPSPSIRVTTSADGADVRQGGSLTIFWQSTNAPPGSAVALFPEKVLTGRLFDPIAVALPPNGSYTWQIPVFVMPPVSCAPDITGGCVGSMNPTIYRIVARLYTPADANLTEFGPGKTYPTWIARTESNEFTMLTAAQ